MQSTVSASVNSFRPDLQGLRAVAIALVVLAHTNVPGFSGGFVGVDVFFVLSGYLITGLLVQERMSTGSIFYGKFLARRLRRLLPALLVMLVVVLTTASFSLSAYETRMQSGSFLFSATWTSNFFFAFVDRDYFSALQSEDLFLHTWSLGIEEQFYVVWPWLLIFVFFLVPKKYCLKRARNVVLGALGVVFVASLLLCLYWAKNQQLLSFYMMPARAWQFALGAAVYVRSYEIGRSRFAGTAIGIGGLLLIVGSAVFLGPDINYPGFFALFPSLGAAMVIAAGTGASQNLVNSALSSKYFVWLGDRSYSLYLWHWPVLILGNSFGIKASVSGILLLIIISTLLAMLSYRQVELPFWKGRYSQAKSSRTFLVSLLMVVAAIGVSDGLYRNVYGDRSAVLIAQNYYPRQDVSRAIYGRGLGCDTWYFSTELVPCAIGERDGEHLAILLGDSIGAQWSTLVSGVFSAPDWQVLVLTKSSCAIVDESYYYEKAGGDYVVCTEWRNKALEYIAALEPDVVIIGSSATYDFTDSQWVDGSSRVLSKLSKAAFQVVVVAGTPELTFDGPSCLEEPYRFSYRLLGGSRECEEVESESTSEDVVAYLRRSVADFSNANVLDLGDLVCPEGKCAARTKEGTVVFRDQQHLTMTFVNEQIDEARARLQAMGIDSRFEAVSTDAMESE